MPPRVIGLIPARLASSRLPGKVLLDGTGKPMIQHVWEAASRIGTLSDLYVATDDERIASAVDSFGGRAILTSVDHPNGSSRLAEAAALLGLDGEDVVVNVQGDEPELEPEPVELALAALMESSDPVATLASPFGPTEDANDPSVVKVVLRGDGRALYFSRSRIPHVRGGTRDEPGSGATVLKHVGLYVYRRSFLDRYVALPTTPLEKSEGLEQLRILEHGWDIRVAVAEVRWAGIDTAADYEAFVRRCGGA